MNVWTNTSVRRSNGGEVQLGFGFPHSLIAALQEEAWLQQLSTINCHPVTLSPLPLTAQTTSCHGQQIRQSSPSCRLLRAGSGSNRDISDYSNGPVAAVYRSRRSGTKADDRRNPLSFRR